MRKKALEVVEEYLSLHGIERVVIRDSLKAILTLRAHPHQDVQLRVRGDKPAVPAVRRLHISRLGEAVPSE
jgi:hypothetical protein